KDILGHFKPARQLKYLIVAVEYFTKWTKAKALASITGANIIKFFEINILTHFEVPQAVVPGLG
ncbi:gypsy retrotransposon integrase-like protein, partial [Trifolium medium]|nr:gypsy retrotransposon integrase-like protein [Trifolium medium]